MFGFADLGLGLVIGRYISVSLGKNDLAAVRRYFGTGNLIVLPVLVLMTLAYIGLTVWLCPLWFDKMDRAEVGLLRGCLVVNGLGLFFSYYGAYWLAVSQAHLDFKFIGLIKALFSPLQIIPSLLLAWSTRNPFWVLVWTALIAVLQLAFIVWHARRHYAMGLCLGSASLACAREMAGYITKMVLTLMVGVVLGPLIPNLFGRLASPAAFVPYNLSNNIASRLQSLSMAVMGPVLHNTARVIEDGRAAAAKIYNDSFAFVFDWYLLVALWLALWHPVLLRLYLVHTMGSPLGEETARTVGPLLVPLVAACCFTSLTNISNSQLISLNRLGPLILFCLGTGLLSIVGVLLGWHINGMIGAVYGYLLSRTAMVAQDLYTIRLIRAGGWLDPHTWRRFAGQLLVAGLFALACGRLPQQSYWMLIPAALHGGLMAAWLARQPLRKFLAGAGGR